MRLFNILVHILTETNRHAGHAGILREQLDGTVGTDPQTTALPEHDGAFWENRCAKIEQAAKAADPVRWPARVDQVRPGAGRAALRGCA